MNKEDCKYYVDKEGGKRQCRNGLAECRPTQEKDFIDKRHDEFKMFDTLIDACEFTHGGVSYVMQITEEQIEGLRQGKVLVHQDEYTTVVKPVNKETILKEELRNALMEIAKRI